MTRAASISPPHAAAPPPADGDCRLARAAQAGDLNAFAQLSARYRRRVYHLTRHMVATPADAEEVLQETFLSLFRALPQLRVPSHDKALSAWIFRIGVNAALMHLRARRRRPVLHIEDMPHNAQAGSVSLWPQGMALRRPDEMLLDGELKGRLQAAMQALPDKYRLVLWLRDIEQQSQDEVAQTLGLTVPTVKARLHRARLAVRDALAVYLEKT